LLAASSFTATRILASIILFLAALTILDLIWPGGLRSRMRRKRRPVRAYTTLSAVGAAGAVGLGVSLLLEKPFLAFLALFVGTAAFGALAVLVTTDESKSDEPTD
jgi:hypothetical protein